MGADEVEGVAVLLRVARVGDGHGDGLDALRLPPAEPPDAGSKEPQAGGDLGVLAQVLGLLVEEVPPVVLALDVRVLPRLGLGGDVGGALDGQAVGRLDVALVLDLQGDVDDPVERADDDLGLRARRARRRCAG